MKDRTMDVAVTATNKLLQNTWTDVEYRMEILSCHQE